MTKQAAQLLHPKYRPDVDGLRAIAVLAVVAFHAFPEWLRGGFIGVDVFFVISGFLISTIIFENLNRGTFSLAEFYARRIRRIFPALIVVMLSCYAFGWFALLPNEYQQLGKHMAGGAGFISNFVLWQEVGYFDNSAETKPLLHLWSLGIEEQFYIVFPFLAWFASKRKFSLLILTISIAVVSFSLNLTGIKEDASATFYLPHTRIWELLSGGVLAHLALHPQRLNVERKTFNNVLSFVGFLILLYGFLRINKGLEYPGIWAVVPVLGAVFILSAGPKAWINQHCLSHKIAVWFGLISYPLYLWHWPLLSFARIIENGDVSYEIRIAAVLLSVVLAWLTYRIVERPVRLGGAQGKTTAVLLVLMLGTGLLGYFTYKNEGLSYRLNGPKEMLNEIISTPYPAVSYFECQTVITELRDSKFDDCSLTKMAPPTILFIGDSHTKQFRSTDWKKFGDNSILMLTKSECLPFANDQFLTKSDCKKAFEAAIDYATKSASLKTVLLSSYWAYLMSGDFEKKGNNWRIAQQPDSEDIATFQKNFRFFVSKLLASGKDVIFMMDIPDLDFDVNTCFDNRPLRITAADIRSDCAMSEASFLQRQKAVDGVLNEVLQAYPNVQIYNPRGLFCDNGKCIASDGALPYYTNGDHLNHYGASLIMDDLIRNFFKKHD